MALANIHVKVNSDIKTQSEEVLGKIGISMSDFVNMSLRRLVFEQQIPFSTLVAKKELPENMRVESREQLQKLMDRYMDEDDGTRYTTAELREKLGLVRKTAAAA